MIVSLKHLKADMLRRTYYRTRTGCVLRFRKAFRRGFYHVSITSIKYKKRIMYLSAKDAQDCINYHEVVDAWTIVGNVRKFLREMLLDSGYKFIQSKTGWIFTKRKKIVHFRNGNVIVTSPKIETVILPMTAVPIMARYLK